MTTQALKNISLRISSGGTPSRKRPEYFSVDSGHLWVKSKELLDSGISNTEEKITDEALNNSSAKYFPEHSVLIAMYGANVGQLGWLKNPATVNQAVCGLVIDPEKADWRYIFYALLQNRNDLTIQARGAAQQNLNQDLIKDFELSLLPIENQHSVADVLSTYDDLIYNNTRRIQILEQTAQAIYKEWFTSQASKEWNVSALRDVIDSYIGGGWGKEKPDENYPSLAYVIRGTDIPNTTMGNILTCPLRYHKPSNLRTRALKDGDLVFEVSGGSKGQPVGRSLLITSNLLSQFKENVICASFCKLIRLNQNKISPFQLYEQILSWYENGVIEKYQVQSTGISNFRFESFIDEEKVTLPPDEIREKFDHLVSPLFGEIYSLGNQNQNLRQARDLLLPKLVTGEIKV